MNEPNPGPITTRDHILQLLSDGELANFSSSQTEPQLRRGQQYLDLAHLAQGVQRADGSPTAPTDFLPRHAIHEDTWRRILRQLQAASTTPT